MVSEALGTYNKTDEDVGDGSVVNTTLVANASQVKLSLSGDDAAAFVLSDPIAAGLTNAGARDLTFKAVAELRVADGHEQGQRLQGDGGGDRQEGPHRYDGS